MGTRRAALTAAAAIETPVTCFVLEQTGEAASSQIGLSGILFGATVLAISDIFGGNAFLPVLFHLAALISGKAVLPQALTADIRLTAVAMLLTVVYALGLLFRPRRRVFENGVDSLIVLVLHVAGRLAVESRPRRAEPASSSDGTGPDRRPRACPVRVLVGCR